ncbi:MAG: GNAT family N-acetyltransferase [Micrococcales bacterium]|nr:GNAT family N-acetyltransferase [Micrococcales bacterium]
MAIEVTRDEARHRYEATVDGTFAGYAEYVEHEGVVTFPRTVVEPAFEGQGVASAIARRSLDDASAAGLLVRPDCSFYARWIERHPDYGDLVA